MKTIDLSQQVTDLVHILELANDGPLMVIAPDGREYMVAATDDFDREVAQLRASASFQQFLDERLAARHQRRPIQEVLREVESVLAHEAPPEAPSSTTR